MGNDDIIEALRRRVEQLREECQEAPAGEKQAARERLEDAERRLKAAEQGITPLPSSQDSDKVRWL